MKGQLTLIPTPISDELPLCSVATKLLQDAAAADELILVEEHKVARRRWLKYGLPREAIDNFLLYNEHTYKEAGDESLKALKKGKNVFLMSDCGLPAFCDPGRRLVELCHKAGVKVTASPFANSIALAVALSGFDHAKFVFEGFIPAKSETRKSELKRIMKSKLMSIIMDTPYRMNKLIDELAAINEEREIFLGMNLNNSNERLLRGSLKSIQQKMAKEKHEFILIVGPLL